MHERVQLQRGGIYRQHFSKHIALNNAPHHPQIYALAGNWVL